MKKLIAILIISAVMASAVGLISPVYAVNLTENSLTIVTEYDETILPGINVELFLIADAVVVNGNITYSPTEDFADALDNVNLNANMSAESNVTLAGILKSYASQNDIHGTTAITNVNGQTVFSNLTAALYLVAQSSGTNGNNSKYIMQSFIVPVPYLEIGGLNRNVIAQPKLEPVKPPTPPTITTTETTTEKEEEPTTTEPDPIIPETTTKPSTTEKPAVPPGTTPPTTATTQENGVEIIPTTIAGPSQFTPHTTPTDNEPESSLYGLGAVPIPYESETTQPIMTLDDYDWLNDNGMPEDYLHLYDDLTTDTTTAPVKPKSNPLTGDNIFIYVLLLGFVIVGGVTLKLYKNHLRD